MTQSPLRPAEFVMSPERAGAAFPTPLNFARSFVRRMVRGRWTVTRLRFDLDGEGRGEALYRLDAEGRAFHFPVNSDFFPQDQKVDRSFGINWDASGALCEGDWTDEREARLRPEITLQYIGRYDPDTLCFTRGNRSERIFDEVVEALARGRQPDPASLAPVGYIFRTTAFAGNGLFGMRPFDGLDDGHPLREPYHVQMAAAFLLREFVFDLAEHLARTRSGVAVPLDRNIRRYLGLGNSAGQGLIPFIANHPHLIHSWCQTLEEARAEAAARPVSSSEHEAFRSLLAKAIRYFTEDPRDGNGIFLDYAELARQLAVAADRCAVPGSGTWGELIACAAEGLHLEAGEVLGTLLLEVHPDIVERHDGHFRADEPFDIDPAMRAGELRERLRRAYAWALDGRLPPDPWTANFWYQPVEAPDEPRRGRRGIAAEYEFESRMDVPRLVQRLDAALAVASQGERVADVLVREPNLRHIVRRVQSVAHLPYAELRDSTISADYTPFAAERFLLAFYGMEKLDPRPPRSVKGAFLQGAPTAADLAEGRGGDWPFPLIPEVSAPKAVGGERAPLRLLESPELQPSTIRKLGARKVARVGRETLPFFSTEYRKLMIRALLVAGLPLGLAEDLTELGEFADSREPGSGLGDLLDMLAVLLETPRRRPSYGEGASFRVAAGGEPGAVHAPLTLDLVHARAADGRGAAAFIDDCRGRHLLSGLARRAAARGQVTLLAWRRGRETACIVGLPDRGAGVELACSADWPSPELIAAMDVVVPASLRSDGILIAIPSPEGQARLAGRIGGPGWTNVTAGDIAAGIARTRTSGYQMTAERFASLEAMAKRWLVPDAVEPTVALHPAPVAVVG